MRRGVVGVASVLAVATVLAAVPEEMRGFGHVKAKNVAIARARMAQLRERLAGAEVALAAD